MSTETNALAAPSEGTAESAPAPQPGAVENPDGLKEQAGAGQDEKPQEGSTDPKAGTPKGVQKRLDELTRQRSEAQRMNERLLSVLERTLAGGKPAEQEAPSGPPRREQYETMESYLEAKADWKVAEAVQQLAKKAEAVQQQQAEQQREQSWSQRLKEASTKYEDFEEVAMADDLPVSPVMASAMKEAGNGADIAYFLGKNPSEAARISQLSPAAQVREIGKIEARLEGQTKPAKAASKAPAPIEPVGSGGKSAVNGSLEAMSQREYEAARAKDSRYFGARPK